jgi:hypothetical protein
MWVNQSIPTSTIKGTATSSARDLDGKEVKREVAVQVMPLTEL